MSSLPEQLKLDGAARAAANADQELVTAIDDTIHKMAATGLDFDSEDVRVAIGNPHIRPGLMGARFLAASITGQIVCVGRRKASRKELHAHEIRVWRGKVPPIDDPDGGRRGD